MKTLYVSDLDGTLLRSDQRTSDHTNKVINDFVSRGGLFSYATARSNYTASKVTQGMSASFPLIVYNGVFILDNQSAEIINKTTFEHEEAVSVLKELQNGGVHPIVYSLINGKERFSYIPSQLNIATKEFVESRNDLRKRPVDSFEELNYGELFYITCIDEPEKLEPFYNAYKDRFHCFYQRDIYSGEQWLEIIPRDASKANAIKTLSKLLRCEKIVVFGDAINDMDMFAIADEAYAVGNAAPELKKRATAVIGTNDEDGVAKWLSDNAQADCN